MKSGIISPCAYMGSNKKCRSKKGYSQSMRITLISKCSLWLNHRIYLSSIVYIMPVHRISQPATRTAILSHFYNHGSRGITGGAPAEQKIAAALHHDLLNAFDNRAAGCGPLGMAENQRAAVVVHGVDIDA